MAERLQKVMANAGVASRRASEKLIQEGRVMVNGVVVTELGTKVESDDSISVDGKLLKKDEKKVYYLLYKPRGVISAAKDNKGREVVTDYLKDVSERLGITQQTYARLEANPASAGFERLFRVFSVLGVEIVLSSREPLSDAKPEYGAMHNYSSLPARREKW